MESALRPRDIQARIRAGESPEDVAAAAKTSVESIMAFATPVLAERAHIAQTAQKASIRRRTETAGSARTLGESAGLYLEGHSLYGDDVTWDAWRQADGRWALVATYSLEGRERRAEFTHDLPGRYVVAENDEARLLTGELRDPASGGKGEAPAPSRRLSAVPSDDELPLGDDAIELVRDRPGPAAEEAEVEEAELEEPEAEEPELEQPETLPVEVAEAPATDVVAEEGESVEAEEPELQRRPGRGKRKGRSSIPSWDEIMFGDGKTE